MACAAFNNGPKNRLMMILMPCMRDIIAIEPTMFQPEYPSKSFFNTGSNFRRICLLSEKDL